MVCAEMRRRTSNKRVRLLSSSGRSDRRGRGREEEGVDRLGDLPDEILFLIISSIPVNEAVRTSALSRRWRHLQTLIPLTDNLRLGPVSMNPKLPTSFEEQWKLDKKWVEAVEDQHLQWGLIRRCQILNPMFLPGSRSRQYDRLIEDLVGQGIQELELNHLRRSSLLLSRNLLRAKSLTVLDLKMCEISLCDVSCVNLRTLKLEHVTVSDILLQKIISTCKQQLEILHMVDCDGFRSCRIHASSLKQLLLRSSCYSYVKAIDVDAPNLRTFMLSHSRLENLDLHAPEIREVCFNLPLKELELVATKLKGFLAAATQLSCLTFRSNSVLCMSRGEPEGYPISFQTLKVLSVSMELKHKRKALLVVELLENCPQLRQLTLSITGGYGVKPKQFSKYREKLQRLPCFPHHLEEVKLSCFTARTYQMKLARLFLREAKVLKKMTLKLRSSYSEELPTAVKDLLAMKNASTQVIVMTHMDNPIQFL